MSTEIRLSAAKPCLRSSQPLPLPSVNPGTPVVVTRPPVVARPKACVSASSSPQLTPAWTRAVFFFGSTRMAFRLRVSITIPPSAIEKPATEWPPPRIASGAPLRRARPTARITSAVPAGRKIVAGLRSNMPLKTARVSSYSALPGSITWPRKPSRSSSSAEASSTPVWVTVSVIASPLFAFHDGRHWRAGFQLLCRLRDMRVSSRSCAVSTSHENLLRSSPRAVLSPTTRCATRSSRSRPGSTASTAATTSSPGGSRASPATPGRGSARGATTEKALIGTAVTPAVQRYHPALVAQCFATLEVMFPGRVFLGYGSGESLNESPLGCDWPDGAGSSR